MGSAKHVRKLSALVVGSSPTQRTYCVYVRKSAGMMARRDSFVRLAIETCAGISISAKDIPTIDIQGLANNVFCFGGREKYRRRRNFARMSHASVRHGKSHLAFLLSQRKAKLAGVEGVDTIPHFGINNARCDSVHPDAVLD